MNSKKIKKNLLQNKKIKKLKKCQNQKNHQKNPQISLQ